jgi:hypothetical protein
MANRTVGYNAAGTALDYTTFASAIAASSTGDVLQVYYSGTAKQTAWHESVTVDTIALTIQGMLANQLLTWSAQTVQSVTNSANLTITNFWLTISITGAAGTCAVTIRNCLFLSVPITLGTYLPTATYENAIYISASGSTNYAPFSVTTAGYTLTCKNCLAYGSLFFGFRRGNGTMNCYNCVGLRCVSGAFGGTIGGDHNASDDGTGPATNLINIAANDPHFWRNDYTATQINPFDWRITTASSLYHAGSPTNGAATDLWGVTRDMTTPSIGPFEGQTVSTDLAGDQVLAGNTYYLHDGTSRAGTFNEAARNTDPGAANVLRQVDGGPAGYLICNVSKTPAFNLATAEMAYESGRNTAADPAKYLTGSSFTQFGTAVNGSFDEAARNTVPTLSLIPTPATGGPTAWLQLNVSRIGTLDLDAVKTAYETARNNASGTVAADLAVGKSVLIRNVTISGASDKLYSAADEASRNTDPGVGYVLTGHDYKICNVGKTAAFDEAVRNTDPGVGYVLVGHDYMIQGAGKTAAYTPDFPARTDVAPDATVNHQAGTMDLPVLAKVAPSATLRGSAGTMDLPAVSSVDPLATLEGVTGTMNVPALSSVLSTDTLRNVPGTYDATIWEASRNTAADPAMYLSPNTFKQFGLTVAGTFLELARNVDPGQGNVLKDVPYKIANVDKLGIFDEADRNVGVGANQLLLGSSIKIRNITTDGRYNPASSGVIYTEAGQIISGAASIDTLVIPPPPTATDNRAQNIYTLHGAFVTTIRRHFAQPENIEVPELRHYAWNSDDKVSKILIESVHRWNPTNIQQRPGVIVKRGPWKFIQLGIGNRLEGGVDTDGYTEDSLVVGVMGTHSFFCLGTSGTEADEIAMEVVNCLLCFSQTIREQFCLARFMVSDIGPVTKMDECQDHFTVPVNVEYSMQWNWKLLRQSPIWARTNSLVAE